MKSKLVLWILPVALICLAHGQNQVANNLENSYVAEHPASIAASPEPASPKNGNTPPAALFSGADVPPALASGAGLDDGVLVAYAAILAAKARIHSNRNCQKFFHSEGEQALENTHFTLQYLPIPRIAAQVEGQVVLLNRTPSGAFMTPPQDLMGLTDPTEIRAFYILHELAHELKRYTGYLKDHYPSADISEYHTRLNNELLFQNCYRNAHPMVAAR